MMVVNHPTRSFDGCEELGMVEKQLYAFSDTLIHQRKDLRGFRRWFRF